MSHDLSKMPASFRAALDAAFSRPILLAERAVAAVHAGAGFAPRAGYYDDEEEEPSKKAPLYTRDGEVGIVTIEGPLSQRAWSCWMLQGDGYDAIVSRVAAALGDSAVRAVVLRIDSPGGEVAGCFEAVRALRAASKEAGKPLIAYADEMACSAAYALACACDEIVVPDTGCVGSIGVILALTERSRELDALGVTVNVITSGAAKADGHPAIPLSPDARARIQAEIDQLADVFAAEVALARPLDASEVRGLQAQSFYGTAALSAGLADRVGNFRAAVDAARVLAARQSPRGTGALGAKRTSMEALKAMLGLTADATDAQVFERINALNALEKDTLLLTESKSTEEARGALRSMAKRASQAAEAEAALVAERATRVASERAALKKLGIDKRVLSPADIDADGKGAEAVWIAEMSNAGLDGYITRELKFGRTIVPEGEHKAPSEAPVNDAQMPPEIAVLVAKGWSKLTTAEKQQLGRHDKKLSDRLRKQG